MIKKNISSETINCDYCRNYQDNKVQGLKHIYHPYKMKTGIVLLSLKTVLDRRLEYKKIKKDVSDYCRSYYNDDNLSTTANNDK